MTDVDSGSTDQEALPSLLELELEALRFRVASLDKLVRHNAELQVRLARLEMGHARGDVGSHGNPIPIGGSGGKGASTSTRKGAQQSLLVIVPPRSGPMRVPGWELARLLSVTPPAARLVVAAPAGASAYLRPVGTSDPKNTQFLEAPGLVTDGEEEPLEWAAWLSEVVATLRPGFVTHLGPIARIAPLHASLARHEVKFIARAHHDDFVGETVEAAIEPLLQSAAAILVTSMQQRELLAAAAIPLPAHLVPPAVTMPATDLSLSYGAGPCRILYMHDVADPAPLAEFVELAEQLRERDDVQLVLFASSAEAPHPGIVLRPIPSRSEMMQRFQDVELCYLPRTRTDMPQWLADCMALGRIPVMSGRPSEDDEDRQMCALLEEVLAEPASWVERGGNARAYARQAFRRGDWKDAFASAMR